MCCAKVSSFFYFSLNSPDTPRYEEDQGNEKLMTITDKIPMVRQKIKFLILSVLPFFALDTGRENKDNKCESVINRLFSQFT